MYQRASPAQNLPAFTTAHLTGDQRFLVICDHASNYLPPEYDNLGLPPEQLDRHIASDLGALAVAGKISERLNCPLVASQFSRLLIDPNRGLDDPTLVMKLSDGAVIPGNQNVDPYGDRAEWQRRIDLFYKPYDAAIKSALQAAKTAGIAPIILSVHSFTPIWRGTKRPWHAGVLWDKDPRLAKLMMSYMAQLPDLVFGDNEPYDGQLIHDTLYRHGTSNGLPHAIIELRQDEIETNAQQDVWAARLVDFLRLAVSQADIATYQYFGSVNDAPNG